MKVVSGRVQGGKVIVEDGELVEGSVVTVVTRGPVEPLVASPEDAAVLCDRATAADRGDTVGAADLLADLRRRS